MLSGKREVRQAPVEVVSRGGDRYLFILVSYSQGRRVSGNRPQRGQVFDECLSHQVSGLSIDIIADTEGGK